MSLSAADRDCLATWWRAVCAAPDAMPAGLTAVQVRRVRAVARGALPDAGSAYAKWMAFPRLRDRIRYLLRALPGPHEARMLDAVRRAGVCCPAVLSARGARRRLLPYRSLLVTAALPVDPDARPAADAVAAATKALVEAGIHHPDLHPANFVALRDGGVAVLDLQSARQCRPGLGARTRVALLGKLLEQRPQLAPALTAAGFAEAEVASARRHGEELARRAPLQRVRRCFRDSTEFERRLRWCGREYRRRAAAGGGRWVEGGPELRRLWVGDRTLEVLDGRPPVLGALLLKWLWLPGHGSVYIPPSNREVVLPREAPILLEGYERFRKLSRGGVRVHGDCPG